MVATMNDEKPEDSATKASTKLKNALDGLVGYVENVNDARKVVGSNPSDPDSLKELRKREKELGKAIHDTVKDLTKDANPGSNADGDLVTLTIEMKVEPSGTFIHEIRARAWVARDASPGIDIAYSSSSSSSSVSNWPLAPIAKCPE